MVGLSLVNEIVQRVESRGNLGPSAQAQEIEEPVKGLATHGWMIDEWMPNLDDRLGEDLMPGRGQLLIEKFQGAGTLSANYSCNSHAGKLDSVYKNGDIVLTRHVDYRDSGIDSLQVVYSPNDQGASIYAELFHFDRETPSNSFSERQGWRLVSDEQANNPPLALSGDIASKP
ncbi:MAG: hypothetical protein KC910_04790 [Candidatus Eremiobacteraeota bacterium]|nr:hypothetical protein [Candidatus Eremiobacteraeota bacterium]